MTQNLEDMEDIDVAALFLELYPEAGIREVLKKLVDDTKQKCQAEHEQKIKEIFRKINSMRLLNGLFIESYTVKQWNTLCRENGCEEYAKYLNLKGGVDG